MNVGTRDKYAHIDHRCIMHERNHFALASTIEISHMDIEWYTLRYDLGKSDDLLYMCIFSYIDGYFVYSGSDVEPLNISIINHAKVHSLTANCIILVSPFYAKDLLISWNSTWSFSSTRRESCTAWTPEAIWAASSFACPFGRPAKLVSPTALARPVPRYTLACTPCVGVIYKGYNTWDIQ